MASTFLIDANAAAESAKEKSNRLIEELEDLALDASLSFNISTADSSPAWGLQPWNADLIANTVLGTTADVPGVPPPALEDPTNPADVLRDEISTTLGEIPALPESTDFFALTDVGDLPTTVIPEFTESAPIISGPSRPITALPTAPAEHAITIPSLHEWKNIALPEATELIKTEIDKFGALEIDTVDLAIPEFTLTQPTNTFSFVEEEYSSDLLTSIQTLLVSDVENGGYGIEPTDEQALYERGREREAKTAAVAVTRARNGIAARGFPMPPGSLYAAEQVILKDGQAALSDLNREIVLKRSDLYVAARQFAVQQGLNLEQTMIAYVGAKAERALKTAQLTADFVIQFHNAAVQLFEVKIELKKLYTIVHKAQLETAVTKIQEYGQELAYADSENKRNQAQLQEYNQQLEGVKTFYDIQRMQDEQTKILIEVEQLKLQAHQDKVSIYATNVQAYAEEYSGYQAAWQAVDIEQSAFGKRMEAHGLKIESQLKTAAEQRHVFDSKIAARKVERDKHSAMLEHRNAELRSDAIKVELALSKNKNYIDMWSTEEETRRFNTDLKFRTSVEEVKAVIDTQRSNVQQMQVASNALLKLKELNSSHIVNALQLLEKAMSGSESSYIGIENIPTT